MLLFGEPDVREIKVLHARDVKVGLDTTNGMLRYFVPCIERVQEVSQERGIHFLAGTNDQEVYTVAPIELLGDNCRGPSLSSTNYNDITRK